MTVLTPATLRTARLDLGPIGKSKTFGEATVPTEAGTPPPAVPRDQARGAVRGTQASAVRWLTSTNSWSGFAELREAVHDMTWRLGACDLGVARVCLLLSMQKNWRLAPTCRARPLQCRTPGGFLSNIQYVYNVS